MNFGFSCLWYWDYRCEPLWTYVVFKIKHRTSCMLGRHSTSLGVSPASFLSSVYTFVWFCVRFALSLSCLEFVGFLVLFNGFLWSWKIWGYLFLPVFFLPPSHFRFDVSQVSKRNVYFSFLFSNCKIWVDIVWFTYSLLGFLRSAFEYF